MGKRLLLAVDIYCAPPALYALHSIDDLFERAIQDFHVIVMTVVPVTAIPIIPDNALSAAEGIGLPHLVETIIKEERQQAQETLEKARTILETRGIAPERIECVQSMGRPADEVVRAAKEFAVDCIVIGSRGNALGQRIRRLFGGSISRSIVAHAPCPVVVVALPRGASADKLVSWYETAIRRYLHERSQVLTVLTAREVAQMFTPRQVSQVGRKEIAAAQQALKRLTHEKMLHRREVKGETRYVND